MIEMKDSKFSLDNEDEIIRKYGIEEYFLIKPVTDFTMSQENKLNYFDTTSIYNILSALRCASYHLQSSIPILIKVTTGIKDRNQIKV